MPPRRQALRRRGGRRRDAVQSVGPVFDAIGQRTFVVSAEPKAANLVKLSGNFLIASVIESLGEAMALVAKAGVDKQAYLELLTSTLFGAQVYRTYGGLLARDEFEPAGFAAPTSGSKDVRLVLAAAEHSSAAADRQPACATASSRCSPRWRPSLDWSAVGVLPAWEAGGPSPTARD